MEILLALPVLLATIGILYWIARKSGGTSGAG